MVVYGSHDGGPVFNEIYFYLKSCLDFIRFLK